MDSAEHAISDREQKTILWVNRIKDWENSGLSGTAWCQTHNIKYHQYLYWKKRLSQNEAENLFIEMSEPESTTGIEIIIDSIKVRVPPNFDSVTFRRCLQILRGL